MKTLKVPQLEIPFFRCYNLDTKSLVYCFKGCSPQTAFVSTYDSWAFYQVQGGVIKIGQCLGNQKNSYLSKGSGIIGTDGLEIFEHDIVKNLTCEFSVGKEKIFLCGEVYIKDGVFLESYFHQPIHTYDFLEVAGNRWETPDLLESCPPLPEEEEEDNDN